MEEEFLKPLGITAYRLGIQMEYDLRKEKVEIECVLEEIKEYN